MKVTSINVALPKTVQWKGKAVSTAIFKEPVAAGSKIKVRTLNIEGDGQADLRLHGGRDKAVYAYGVDAFQWWEEELGRPMVAGEFGENLTVDRLDESSIYVGDRFRLGSALLQVTQPRLPCYKLGLKFGTMAILRTFMESRRPGVYFRVLEPGEIEIGETLERLSSDPQKVSVYDLFHLQTDPEPDPNLLKRMLLIDDLTPGWRESAEEWLE